MTALNVHTGDVARRMMEKVKGYYDDPETAGKAMKEEIDWWLDCRYPVFPEILWAMHEVLYLYDTRQEALRT